MDKDTQDVLDTAYAEMGRLSRLIDMLRLDALRYSIQGKSNKARQCDESIKTLSESIRDIRSRADEVRRDKQSMDPQNIRTGVPDGFGDMRWRGVHSGGVKRRR